MEKIIVKYLSKKYNRKEKFIKVLFEINKMDNCSMFESVRLIALFLSKKQCFN